MLPLNKTSNSTHPSNRASRVNSLTAIKFPPVEDKNCNKVHRASRIPVRTNRGKGSLQHAFPDKEVVIIKKNKPLNSQYVKLPPICPSPTVVTTWETLKRSGAFFSSEVTASPNLRTQTRTLERFPRWKSPPDYLPVIINNRTIPPKKPRHFKSQITKFNSSVVPLPKINLGPTPKQTAAIVNRYSRKPAIISTTNVYNGVQQTLVKKVTSLPLLPARMIQKPSKNDESNPIKVNEKLIHTHTTPNANKLFKYQSKYAKPQLAKKPSFAERFVAQPLRRMETKNLPPLICQPPIPTTTKIVPFHHQHQLTPRSMIPIIPKTIAVTRVTPQFSKLPFFEPQKMNQLKVQSKYSLNKVTFQTGSDKCEKIEFVDEIREYNEKKMYGLEMAALMNEAPTPKTTLTSDSEESFEGNENDENEDEAEAEEEDEHDNGGGAGIAEMEGAGFVPVEYVEHSSDEYYYTETSDEDEVEPRSPAYYDGDSESC